jgi:hypothetical protein
MALGYKYSRCDWTQRLSDLDQEDLMDELSEAFLKYGDMASAFESLMAHAPKNRTGKGMPGIFDFKEMLNGLRQMTLQQYNLDSMLDDLKDRLEEVLNTERFGINRHFAEARKQANVAYEERIETQRLLDFLEARAAKSNGLPKCFAR